MSAPPRRTDLPYLRHRRRPPTAASPSRASPEPASPEPTGAAPIGPVRRSATSVFVPRRTGTGAATVLTARRPYVLLDRLQSGVGALTVRAAWDTPEHARLGCAYRLRSGRSTIARTSDVPGADEPLTLTVLDGVPTIRLDLLRCRRLDRLIVFVVPHHELLHPSWQATLQVGTYGGALVDVPFDRPATAGVLVLLSVYNVQGEFAVRAELDHVTGSVRDATTAHGFDGVTWPDGHGAPPSPTF